MLPKRIPSCFALRFGNVIVGCIRDLTFSDDTWYGHYHPLQSQENEGVELRVNEYVRFSSDWHDRAEANPQNPPSAAEFDKYSDIISSGQWSAASNDGESFGIVDAPVFFSDGSITWRTS